MKLSCVFIVLLIALTVVTATHFNDDDFDVIDDESNEISTAFIWVVIGIIAFFCVFIVFYLLRMANRQKDDNP
jgi:high-affinity nickel permease